MPNDTTHPHSVPAHYQGTTQKGFQGGKAKVLELFNALDLEDFLNQFTQQILPLQAAQWFALDCAKLVLYAFEEQYPSDKRVSNCIEVVESYLNGKSSLYELKRASAAVNAAVNAAANAAYDAAAAVAAYAAGYTVNYAALSAASAAYAAGYTVNYAALSAASAACAYYAAAAGRCAADATSKDEMQAFIKNWIDNYFNAK